MDEKDLESRLAWCENRYRILLEIGNAIVSNLEKDLLFKAIAEQIKKVLAFDRTGITIYNPLRDNFMIYVLETSISPLHLKPGMEIPHKGSAIGWVLDHRRYHIRYDLAQERLFIEDELFYKEGLRTILNLPLTNRGILMGTFNIASKTPNYYLEPDIEFLTLVADQIAIAIDNAKAYEEIKRLRDQLNEERLYLQEEIKTEYNFEEIVGRSGKLRKVLQSVEQVAPTDSTVLISGETGTGKELIARAIHHLSKRRERALIKVNCAALPPGLIESELFGHEKGSFTGATHKKVGRFELADKGTLFLDEVGDLPQELQVKLLRVLQEREFERVGGTQTIKVDVRVIAATNHALAKGVKEGRFRSDLYYRLNVFPILLPALRDRAEDIPLLAQYFVNKHMRRMGKRFEGINQETIHRLIAYSWPGNIRELENVIERAVIISKGPILKVEEDLSVFSEEESEGQRGLTLEKVERSHIIEILKGTRWVVGGSGGAAKILNMHPNTLRSRMDKLGIKRDQKDIPPNPIGFF